MLRRIAQAARRYQAATPEQRSAWRSAHEALSPDQARAWLLGPDAGADVLRLRPLFAFVPAGERDSFATEYVVYTRLKA